MDGELATDAMLMRHFEAVERARFSCPEPVIVNYFFLIIFFIFFFKQKPAYEMLRRLVGSEMWIRESPKACGSVITSPRKIDEKSTSPAFLAVPMILSVVDDVRLMTRNEATLTAKPREAARATVSGRSRKSLGKAPSRSALGSSRKHASPHIHSVQIGAIQYWRA